MLCVRCELGRGGIGFSEVGCYFQTGATPAPSHSSDNTQVWRINLSSKYYISQSGANARGLDIVKHP